jgi:hypothetical protein
MYALVIDNSIQATTGRLPSGAKRLDTGQWITPYQGQWTQAEHEACGWYGVTDTQQPADTPTHTHDRSVELVAGVPTVVWTQRPKTQTEIDNETEQTNAQTIRQQAEAALAANNTFLGLGTPTNAQNEAQLVAITRQVNKLIRLAVNKFDGTD